jgi:TolA-binding protein/cell division protein FtsN
MTLLRRGAPRAPLAFDDPAAGRARRRLLPLLVGAALAAAFPAAAAGQAGGVFEEGVDRFRAGDFREAQRLLREYVELAGEQGGEAAANLGEAYHYLGVMTPDAKLAEGYFLAVAERYPTSPLADESVARLARLYAARGDYVEARRQWQALASSYPFSRYRPEASLRIGETHFAEGNWTAAFDAFSAGFARMKDYQREGGRGANLRDVEGEHVYWLGRTLLAREAHADARKYLNLLVLDYPGHALEPLALYYLAESHRGAGDEREAADVWQRFSEGVRNTSLESVAESPNLPAVARAREAGALDRPDAAARAGAGDDEPRVPADQPLDEAAPAERETAEERVQPPPVPVADRAGRERGDDTAAAEDAEAVAEEPPADAPSRDAEGEAPPMRAPEPGRAGGVAEGRGAEDRAGGPAAEEDRAEAPPDRDVDAGRGAPADGERALRGAVPAPRELPAAEPAPAPAAPPAPAPSEEDVAAAAPPAPAPEAAPPARTPEAPAAPAPVPEAAPRPLEPIEPGTVFLQVGAFTRAQSASGLSSELRRKGFEPSIETGLVNGDGYYRVRVGPFQVPAERARLEEVRAALAAAGYGPVVTRPGPGS